MTFYISNTFQYPKSLLILADFPDKLMRIDRYVLVASVGSFHLDLLCT